MEKVKKKISLYCDSTINFLINSLSEISTKEGFKKYFKNTGWLFIGRMSGMIASFFVGAYVARYLGPEQYGLLNYALSYVAILSIFASLGIDSILNRELVSSPEKKNELLGSGFLIKIIGSIITIILVILSLYIFKSDYTTSLLIVILSIFYLFNTLGIIDIYFQSQVLSKKTVKIQILSLIITTILKLSFILLHLDVIYFAMVYVVDGLILAVGFIISYTKTHGSIIKWKINKNIISKLLKSSWPLMLSGAAITIYMKIDQVMITNMLGSTENGLYSAAVKLSEIWYFIPALICSSIFPSIMQAKNNNPVVYENRLKKLYSLMFYLSVGIAIIISLFSGIIVTSLFGNEYLESINVLKIHVWAGIGVFTGYAITQFIIVEEYYKIYLWMQLIGVLLNIILNIILIPRVGIMGSAIATAVSYILATSSIVLFKKTRKQFLVFLESILLGKINLTKYKYGKN